jgi:flagellar hook-associated protein FlgK
MATKRKVKRYADEGYVTGDDSNSGMKEARDAIDADIAKTPSADYGDYIPASSSETIKAAKPRVSTTIASAKPSATKSVAKDENYSNEGRYKAAPTISAKKETYRDASGKVQTKTSAADRSADMAARRESLMSGIKNVGSSIGNMFSKAKQNYESTRPVSRQVQKERDQAASRGNLAKGGTASSRADGIATKGKTRGKMC